MRWYSRVAWSFALILTACGGGDGGDDDDSGGGTYQVGSGTLAGTVGGEPWTFVSGETDAFLSDGEDTFWADLYQDPVTASCTGGPSTYRHRVIASIPKTPGRYPMSLSLNATFVIEGDTMTDNLIATKGVIEVDSVTATQIVGGAHIEYDSANVVNGRFTVTVCP